MKRSDISFSAAVTAWQVPYSTGEAIDIGWSDASDASALISLYRYVDGAGTGSAPIVMDLQEDPDGTSDQYSWDIALIADGIYFLYGVIDDQSGGTATSYAPAAVAIDRAVTDTDDGGNLPDLWEQLHFGNLDTDPGSPTDGDDDGLADGREFGEGTNPGVPDVRLDLKEGMNMVALPIDPVPALTSI